MKLLRDKIKKDTYMVSKLCGLIARNELRNDHPQQRKSGQWDKNTRDNFIVTVIKNEDFDPIKICEQLTDEGVVLWLIDGLQRSTTIENYKSGRFTLGKNIDPYIIEYQEAIKDENGETKYNNVTYDLRGKAYKDLPDKLKEEFENCPVDVVKHLDCTDEEVGRHIVRYNSGRAMVPAQKIVAYMSNVAKHVKKLSGHAFFNDCANYSDTADKNGTVDKIISETIMGINFFDSWTKNAQKIGKYLNDNATENMFNQFKMYLDRLLNVITPQTGQLFSQKNALIWFLLFDRFTKTGKSDNCYQLFLEHLNEYKKIRVHVSHEYELVKNSGEYTNHVSFAELDGCKSTKDKGVIEDKLHILEILMNQFLSTVVDEDIDIPKDCTAQDIIEAYIDKNVYDEDMEIYEMEANDVSEVIEDIDSELLSEEYRPSFVALTAYAYKHNISDILRMWLSDFSKHDDLIKGQKENYLHMREEFDNFVNMNIA